MSTAAIAATGSLLALLFLGLAIIMNDNTADISLGGIAGIERSIDKDYGVAPSVNTSSDSYLRTLLDGISTLYFNGKLNSVTKVNYGSLNSGILGTTNHRIGERHSTITISNILKDKPVTTKKVLLHEAIHAYVIQEGLNGGADGHSGDFDEIRKRILRESDVNGRTSTFIDG